MFIKHTARSKINHNANYLLLSLHTGRLQTLNYEIYLFGVVNNYFAMDVASINA